MLILLVKRYANQVVLVVVWCLDSAYAHCEAVCQPSCFVCSSIIGAGCIWKIVQQDNVRPHVARRPLKGVGEIHTPFWPAASPDLSPIECVWDLIGRELRTHTVEELVAAVDATYRRVAQVVISFMTLSPIRIVI